MINMIFNYGIVHRMASTNPVQAVKIPAGLPKGRRDVVLLDAMAAAHNWVSRPLDGPMERCEESGRARQGEIYGMTKRGRAFCLASFLLCCVAALAALRTIPVYQYVYILPVSVRAHRAKVRLRGEGQEETFVWNIFSWIMARRRYCFFSSSRVVTLIKYFMVNTSNG